MWMFLAAAGAAIVGGKLALDYTRTPRVGDTVQVFADSLTSSPEAKAAIQAVMSGFTGGPPMASVRVTGKGSDGYYNGTVGPGIPVKFHQVDIRSITRA